MGDRDIILYKNGMNEELMEWHGLTTLTENVKYSVNILFPEAIFVAASVPEMSEYSYLYYVPNKNKSDPYSNFKYSDYLRDQANLQVLCAGIWQTLGDVIGDEELQKIIQSNYRENYLNYASQYIDRCDAQLIKTDYSKRNDKLRNIAKHIIKKPQSYISLENSLKNHAQENCISINEIDVTRTYYPDDFEW